MSTTRRLVEGTVILAAAFWLVNAPTPAAHAQDAKALYTKSCSSCHGPEGKGDGPAAKMLKPPAAAFSEALKGKSDADIAKVIKEGGKAVGKSPMMPPFGSKLSDQEIQSLVSFVKGLGAK